MGRWIWFYVGAGALGLTIAAAYVVGILALGGNSGLGSLAFLIELPGLLALVLVSVLLLGLGDHRTPIAPFEHTHLVQIPGTPPKTRR
ncbi:MAG: hypothetical protein L3J96_01165 [Thermoplasmata archaeon]|nr:hypothetical protein [Thermoplasmata archaeon]